MWWVEGNADMVLETLRDQLAAATLGFPELQDFEIIERQPTDVVALVQPETEGK